MEQEIEETAEYLAYVNHMTEKSDNGVTAAELLEIQPMTFGLPALDQREKILAVYRAGWRSLRKVLPGINSMVGCNGMVFDKLKAGTRFIDECRMLMIGAENTWQDIGNGFERRGSQTRKKLTPQAERATAEMEVAPQ